jgi:hypothetical protein
MRPLNRAARDWLQELTIDATRRRRTYCPGQLSIDLDVRCQQVELRVRRTSCRVQVRGRCSAMIDAVVVDQLLLSHGLDHHHMQATNHQMLDIQEDPG